MEDRAPNVAAAAMITPHVQSLPAELTCTKRVLSAVYVFAVRGRRRPRVELMAGVVATKASALNCTKVEVAEADGLFALLWWQKEGPRPFTATRLEGSSLAVVGG